MIMMAQIEMTGKKSNNSRSNAEPKAETRFPGIITISIILYDQPVQVLSYAMDTR